MVLWYKILGLFNVSGGGGVVITPAARTITFSTESPRVIVLG